MHTVNVRFVFRRYQGKNPELEGHGTIYAVVTCDGEDSEPFSTNQGCWKQDWKGTKVLCKDRTITEALNQIRGHVKTISNLLQMQGEEVSAYSVKEAYLQTLQTAKTPKLTLLTAFDEYIEFKRAEGEVTGDTVRTYETRREYLEKYLIAAKRKNILVKDFSLKEFDELNRWGLKQGTGQDFVSKVRQLIKTVLKHSRKSSGQSVRADVLDEKLSWSKVTRPTFVAESDIEKIKALRLRPPYQRVFDAWLFARHTCLHFVDYYTLTSEHIQDGFIIKDRQKTGIEQRVPLDLVALGLIQKYGGVEGLPKISDKGHSTALNLVNRYLADICAMADVPKFTFSNARDTYLNEAYNLKNIRPETENSVAGWTSQRQASRYRRASLETIRREIMGDDAAE